MAIDNRHYKALELDKIAAMLSEYATCDDAREAALAIEPKTRLSEVRGLLRQTGDAHMLLAKFGGPSFGGIKNIDNSLARAAAGSTLTLRELLEVAENLRVIRSLDEWHKKQAAAETVLDVYFNSIIPNKYIEDRITGAILSDEEVSDNASPELREIRRKIRQNSSTIREKLDKLTHSEYYRKFLQDSIITQRNGRFVVPVKNEYRSEIQGLVHDTSASGATVFVEPMAVVEANNEIKVLESKERDEIERILAELSAAVGLYKDEIKSGYECAVEINFIFARAKLAYAMNASMPEINDEGIIELKKARHPLLNKDSVVPTDIRLGDDFDTLVITGPNTGGKTVSIKTVGLLTLMAMCGLMLPVSDNSRVCVFKKVFADIGDEQSIEQSLSTFSSHMVNIVDILGQSDDSSLVLIDELGAGTDPVEGAALAMAILERLHINGCKIAATTHYAELKAYALQTARVENGCCEFDVSTLRPTYRLLIGVPGRSNAFAISERLGLDSVLVDRARELVNSENIRFEDVVDTLEASRLGMEKERAVAEQLRAEAMRALEEANRQKAEIELQSAKELERARGEAMRIVEKTKREAYSLMDEIEALKKEKASAGDIQELARRAKQQMKAGLGSLGESADPVTSGSTFEANYVLPRELRVGDEVILNDVGSRGTVLATADKNGNVSVQSGAMKMRVKLSSLRLVEKRKDKTPGVTVSKGGTVSRAEMEVNLRCDIRGMDTQDGITELDRFIDTAVMSGIGEFTVIHGKGTGVLRAAVQQHLKKHPQVKSYRLGVFGEGENGVTIVTMK